MVLASNLENKRHLRAILDTLTDEIITTDPHGTILRVNTSAMEMFGYTEAEMVGSNIEMLMSEAFRGEQEHGIEQYRKNGSVNVAGVRSEFVAQCKDGTMLPIGLTVSEFRSGEERLFTGIIHDLTRRRELENRLADSQVQEQGRIAHELHDGLGGQITGIAMLVKALQRQLDAEGSRHAKEMDDLARHVSEAHAQLRAISHGLTPVAMIPDGLIKALEHLATQTNLTATINCVFSGDGVVVEDLTAAMHYYRITQEAVSNAIRHGMPTEIQIRLDHETDHIVLLVSNNGVSFQHTPDSNDGMGIRTMKLRAELLGGLLVVRPAESGGTTVTCRVPIRI